MRAGWASVTARMPDRLAASTAVAAPSRQDTSRAAAARVDSLLRRAITADEPGVAAVVVERGQTVCRGAVGMADLTLGVPVRPDHRLAIGSMTKSLTAVALLTLVEERRIALDTPLGTYLPDYAGGDRSSVRQLISHTSGIRRLHSLDRYWTRIHDDVTLQDLIGFFRDEPPESEPGTQWAYNNSGYYLLGLLIERTTGLSWEEYLTRRVLAPAGMTRTAGR